MVAADKVGYRPNRLAQAMKRGKTNVVGVWMPLERITPFYLHFLREVSERATLAGYDLMITGLAATMAYDARGKRPPMWPVDGLIAVDAGKAVKVFREDPGNDSTPVVVLGLEEFINGDSVAWDVRGAARQVTEQMISKGCKKIVHVTMDWILAEYPREQRRNGYRMAMEEAGLEPEFLAISNESSSGAERVFAEYLETNTPDGVFAFTDPLAIGAARALLARGIAIPEQCKVWGFGNYTETVEFRVPISTMSSPLEVLADRAWGWLMERMEGNQGPTRVEVLPMIFYERASS